LSDFYIWILCIALLAHHICYLYLLYNILHLLTNLKYIYIYIKYCNTNAFVSVCACSCRWYIVLHITKISCHSLQHPVYYTSIICGSLFVFLSCFFIGHCIVSPSSTYGVWLSLWYLKSSWLWVTVSFKFIDIKHCGQIMLPCYPFMLL
jgi:hypothetical protein